MDGIKTVTHLGGVTTRLAPRQCGFFFPVRNGTRVSLFVPARSPSSARARPLRGKTSKPPPPHHPVYTHKHTLTHKYTWGAHTRPRLLPTARNAHAQSACQIRMRYHDTLPTPHPYFCLSNAFPPIRRAWRAHLLPARNFGSGPRPRAFPRCEFPRASQSRCHIETTFPGHEFSM